jgi:hypothetical protein
MAAQSTLAKIFEKHPYEISQLRNKSVAWFQSQVKDLRTVSMKNPQTLMRGDQQSKGTTILPGTMIMYMYDPKFKDTLPYYDTFPLGFPFKLVPGGFYSLNLHYLPYNLRAILLDKLMQFKTNDNLDEKTKLKFSWQLLDGVSKFAAAKPCVKHYLYEHVKSPFKAIHAQDWATAILLPVEQFVGASPLDVWRDSVNIIRKA